MILISISKPLTLNLAPLRMRPPRSLNLSVVTTSPSTSYLIFHPLIPTVFCSVVCPRHTTRTRKPSTPTPITVSMACTTSDSSLLFSYRALAGSNTKVRLFDAGSHSHHPDGVGFLCLPAFRVPPLAPVNSPDVSSFMPCCVFVRTYHTASIPGVIISHCAITKQLASDGYSMHSSENRIGLIRFPSRASTQPSEDI